MSAVAQSQYNRMAGDAALVAMLGTFNGLPSILTKRPAPPGFDIKTNGPYILSSGPVSDVPGQQDVKNSGGREVVRDIHCFTDLDKSPVTVDAIAERVRFLFQRVNSIAVTGFSIIVAEATGPIEVDEEDALGRIVSVRWILREN